MGTKDITQHQLRSEAKSSPIKTKKKTKYKKITKFHNVIRTTFTQKKNSTAGKGCNMHPSNKNTTEEKKSLDYVDEFWKCGMCVYCSPR